MHSWPSARGMSRRPRTARTTPVFRTRKPESSPSAGPGGSGRSRSRKTGAAPRRPNRWRSCRRGARGGKGPTYDELVESEGRPRLRYWLDRFQTEGILEAAVVYGYFQCVSKGDDLIVLDSTGTERTRFTFPRQRRERRLCLADFFRAEDSGELDVVAFTV